jgi:hypothetical protein
MGNLGFGVPSESQGRIRFISTFNGKFAEKVTKEEAEGDTSITQRTNKMGVTVYERLTDNISGYLTDIRLGEEHPEYGQQITFNLRTGISSESEVLGFSLVKGSRLFTLFMTRLSNPKFDINLPLRVEIFKYDATNSGKQKDFIKLLQSADGGNTWDKIDSFHTKDNPNGLPQLEEIKNSAGKHMGWDGEAQTTYLMDKVLTPLMERVKANKPAYADAPEDVKFTAPSPVAASVTANDIGDDLPW